MAFTPKASFEIVAQDKSKRGIDSASKNLDRLKKQVSLVGVASVAAAGVAGLGALVAAGLRTGDEMAETAEKLGLSVQGLASLREAARQTGVETNKLDLGIQRMTRRIAEAAHGTGEAQDALKELGLDAEHLNELSPDEQFKEIAAAMEGVTNQADRVRLGFKLFDSEGVDLIRTLALGADGLDEAARRAEKYGTALSDIDSRQIQEAGDALDLLKTAGQGLSLQLAAEFAPAVASSAKHLADWIGFITNTALPAFRLMAERIGLVSLNVRQLSEQELLVRQVMLQDQIAELEKKAQHVPVDATRARFGVINQEVERTRHELEQAKKDLEEVNKQLARVRDNRVSEPLAEIDVSGQETRIRAMRAARAKATAEEIERLRKLQEQEAKRQEEEEQRRAEREAEQRAQELEEVRNFFKTREQIELEAYQRRNEIIIANVEDEEERNDLLLENARRRAEALIEIERYKQEEINRVVAEGHHTREQFEKASGKAQVQSVLGTLESISSGVATHSKTWFNINKAAAIANAIVNTAEGVTKALSAYPPPLSFAMAAAQAAAGAAQIAAIRSTQFGSGSTPSVVGSTPTLNGQPVTSSPPEPQGGSSAATVINITIRGDVLTQDRLEEVLRGMFDDDRVVINGNTAQAAVMRQG